MLKEAAQGREYYTALKTEGHWDTDNVGTPGSGRPPGGSLLHMALTAVGRREAGWGSRGQAWGMCHDGVLNCEDEKVLEMDTGSRGPGWAQCC